MLEFSNKMEEPCGGSFAEKSLFISRMNGSTFCTFNRRIPFERIANKQTGYMKSTDFQDKFSDR